MTQEFSSMNTSINSKKLPAIYHKIDWEKLRKEKRFIRVLDFGSGRYITHIMQFVNYNKGIYYPYDPYWMTELRNEVSLACNPDIIVCSNVLCVIKEDKIIQDIVSKLLSYNVPVVFTVYEGDKSRIGKPTTKGYQRNQPLGDYCLHHSLITYHGVITNDKSIVL